MPTIGNTGTPGSWDLVDSNIKEVFGPFTLPVDANVVSVSMYLRGSNSGSQNIKAVIYDKSGSNPNVLKATSPASTFVTALSAGWQTFTFSSPVALLAGDYFIGFIADVTSHVTEIGYDVGSGGGAFNADTYSDGPADPFGSPSSFSGFVYACYATYTTAAGSSGFTIPNEADAAFPDQAEPDAQDFAIIRAAFAKCGVVSGCEITAQSSPDMTVAVASGTVKIDNSNAAVTSGNLTIGTADASNPRFDLISVNSSGTKSVIAGTPSSNPVFPTVPASRAILAAVYVPAGDGAIQTNQIVDKRIILV